MGCQVSSRPDENANVAGRAIVLTPDNRTARLKVIMIGDLEVGKTTFMNRIMQRVVEPQATVAMDLSILHYDMPNNTRYSFQLWDTSGQERFFSVVHSLFRDAACAIAVYTESDRASFEHLRDIWMPMIRNSSSTKYLLVLGNKLDKVDRSAAPCATQEELRQLTQGYSAICTRISAKQMSHEQCKALLDVFLRRVIQEHFIQPNILLQPSTTFYQQQQPTVFYPDFET